VTAEPALDQIVDPGHVIPVSFPKQVGDVDQNEEWFEFEHRGHRRRLGMHDYAGIYSIPGLYESLVYCALECRSPVHVVEPLEAAVAESGRALEELRVLDLGAGNGVVGDLLRRAGVPHVLGIDILPEAASAAERDRPDVYDEYLVADLAEPSRAAVERLERFEANCLVTVAALGFGDIPPEAFARAHDLLPDGGWLAMCIKDRFLEPDDDSGFGSLIRGMLEHGTTELEHRETYVHRRSITGEPLEYVSLVGRKRRDLGISD
jgi:predicted TPR repeat methyltransferase